MFNESSPRHWNMSDTTRKRKLEQVTCAVDEVVNEPTEPAVEEAIAPIAKCVRLRTLGRLEDGSELEKN